MQNRRQSEAKSLKSVGSLPLALAMFVVLIAHPSFAQNKPPVEEKFQKYFVHYVDRRSIPEKALNAIGLSGHDVGRGFALIAGVSYYPNMPILQRELKPVAEDIQKLVGYLKNYEFFDEIVVLKNEHMNFETLNFFLQSYFPGRLRNFPKSRFLFAYSGHGMNEGAKGYLLLNTALHLKDKNNSLNLSNLKVLVDEVVESGHHVLVLLNACYSGAFLRRPFGGSRQFIPKNPGAHAITAGGTTEVAYHQPELGTGSIFFEKLFAGLNGPADMFPKQPDGTFGDGLITVEELATYLRQEIQIFTDQDQNPQFGDISKHGSLGGFFFLNRGRQVAQNLVPEWKPQKATSLGIDVEKIFQKGKVYYESEQYTMALAYLRQAALSGHIEAPSYLGWMYKEGLGVQKNDAEAIRWYRKGAEAGEIIAMWNLAKWYELGRGVAQDYGEAYRWFRRGIEAGDSWAMNSLGWMYQEGLGVPKNDAQAVQWYLKGAEAGNFTAMGNLGYMYSKGLGVKKNAQEAVLWYRKAAEAGEPKSMTNLGNMYRDGSGVPKDYHEAIRWYRKGYEAGDPNAMTCLAYMYETGLGVEKNYEEAIRWYRKGAEAGEVIAMYNLANIYEKGLGGQKNYPEAIRWYRKAAALGDAYAIQRLKDLGQSP